MKSLTAKMNSISRNEIVFREIKSYFAKWNRVSRNLKSDFAKSEIWNLKSKIFCGFSRNEIAFRETKSGFTKNEIVFPKIFRQILKHEKKTGFHEMKLAFSKNAIAFREMKSVFAKNFAISRNEIVFREKWNLSRKWNPFREKFCVFTKWKRFTRNEIAIHEMKSVLLLRNGPKNEMFFRENVATRNFFRSHEKNKAFPKRNGFREMKLPKLKFFLRFREMKSLPAKLRPHETKFVKKIALSENENAKSKSQIDFAKWNRVPRNLKSDFAKSEIWNLKSEIECHFAKWNCKPPIWNWFREMKFVSTKLKSPKFCKKLKKWIFCPRNHET